MEDIVGSSNEQSISGSGGSSNSSRPSSARRTKRHSSSGNVMLDQLLKDLGNRHTIAEDVCICIRVCVHAHYAYTYYVTTCMYIALHVSYINTVLSV